MKNILITGGSGLLGSKIIPALQKKGYTTAVLSRKKQSNHKSFIWDINNNYIDPEAIQWCDHIIHLAGAGIADKKWTQKRKEEIINSRVNGLRIIKNELNKQQKTIQTLVSASGIGYFNLDSIDDKYTENSDYGSDFPSQVCKLWEVQANELKSNAERLAIVRIGIVLTKDGGALSKLLPLFKMGLGSGVGSGKQIMPWIHIDDLVHIFVQTIENTNFVGVFNATADNQVSNKDFGRKLAKALNKPFFLPNVPSFVLKIMMGEMANLALSGGYVDNTKVKNIIGDLKFSKIDDALNDLLN
jgi:uncharacterized protein (TIGR01777 family)